MDLNFSSSPLIPAEVYSNLPSFFKEAAELYNGNLRQKDVFTTSLLSAVSGCLNGVSGIYDKKSVCPNLYSFIVAPPASGKGVLTDTKYVIYQLHDHLYETSNPEEPFRLLVPGDTSAAMILQLLKGNGGQGVMIESEADTVGNVLAQEWGNFNDKLRAAFHNEPIQWSRKTGNEYFEIKNPKLSVTVSGTPGQVKRIIPSSENGLFSRFLFYAFQQDLGWSFMSNASGNYSIQQSLTEKGKKLKEVFHHTQSKPFSFSFSNEQWVEFNSTFSQLFTDATESHGLNAKGIVFRMGVMAFKMGMILSCFRRHEANDDANSFTCTDVDFNNIIRLSKVYLEHSLRVFELLPQAPEENFKDSKKAFLDSLPSDKEFTRAEAIKLGIASGIKERSIDRYLKELVDKKALSKEKMGNYIKA